MRVYSCQYCFNAMKLIIMLLLLDHSLVTVVDDSGWIYADGKLVLYSVKYDNQYSVNIDGSTRLLAVIAENIGGRLGFHLSISNGVISDASWKCTNSKPATNGKYVAMVNEAISNANKASSSIEACCNCFNYHFRLAVFWF